MPLEIETTSPEATIAFARTVAPHLPPGPTLLIGNLAAGKTTFTKGIAAALGAAAESEVTSPTFALIHEYGDPVKLYHLDLYRLDTAREVYGLGIEDLLDARVPVLIEWGERFPEIWPPHTPRIRFTEPIPGHRRILCEGIPR
ncbi:MAG: tRNA (adenosine(37)-N6)-threonylcarbamoyltransferase complex ATPase subunit type 1 TsaE [Bryobacter sp.]|nr:tRNA (adenosine(37)-N6)-threonylcarbamoyltransferase complex ATPase subunit type 1 TsaE [Bryobacter sp.]